VRSWQGEAVRKGRMLVVEEDADIAKMLRLYFDSLDSFLALSMNLLLLPALM